MFASIEREDQEPTCPYYFGAGSCVTGCWEEPRCITDEPINGWKPRQINAPNRVLIEFRVDLDQYGIINPGVLAREHLEYGVPRGVSNATLAEMVHAWRVIERLARM